MKYCLSGRQNKEYIQKADEIKVWWRDRDAILDFIDWNPNARIILETQDELDIKYLERTKILCKNNFAITGNYKPEDINLLNNNNINWFFNYPLASFSQLRRIQNLGASDAYIAGELCHSLDKIEQYFNLNIRCYVNNSGEYYLNDQLILNGLTGSWFRPEDIDNITAIDVCEFLIDFTNLRREQALYRIYAEQKHWDGNLTDIIDGIYREDIINSLIDVNFQPSRSNCGMKCAITGNCDRCNLFCKLATKTMANKIKEQIKNNN